MQSKKVGKILELFISIKGDLNRSNKIDIDLDENGVKNDKFYGKNVQRSVLITSMASYDLSTQNNIDMNYGQLGENILIDYNPYHLEENSRLIIGDVILEISQHCTLCKSLAKVDKNLPELLKEHRGVFAKVINGGNIRKGDAIYLLDK
ncbi:MAG: MOSC domain-containing protein [Arcobacteraceae bacterium]|nr:MOSC domain-containing protein [Arcobacteraceae bacterium]